MTPHSGALWTILWKTLLQIMKQILGRWWKTKHTARIFDTWVGPVSQLNALAWCPPSSSLMTKDKGHSGSLLSPISSLGWVLVCGYEQQPRNVASPRCLVSWPSRKVCDHLSWQPRPGLLLRICERAVIWKWDLRPETFERFHSVGRTAVTQLRKSILVH